MTDRSHPAIHLTGPSGTESLPLPHAPERDASGWTTVSPPGSSVIVRQRPLPDYIREGIARNLGIGTGQPDEA